MLVTPRGLTGNGVFDIKPNLQNVFTLYIHGSTIPCPFLQANTHVFPLIKESEQLN